MPSRQSSKMHSRDEWRGDSRLSRLSRLSRTSRDSRMSAWRGDVGDECGSEGQAAWNPSTDTRNPCDCCPHLRPHCSCNRANGTEHMCHHFCCRDCWARRACDCIKGRILDCTLKMAHGPGAVFTRYCPFHKHWFRCHKCHCRKCTCGDMDHRHRPCKDPCYSWCHDPCHYCTACKKPFYPWKPCTTPGTRAANLGESDGEETTLASPGSSPPTAVSVISPRRRAQSTGSTRRCCSVTIQSRSTMRSRSTACCTGANCPTGCTTTRSSKKNSTRSNGKRPLCLGTRNCGAATSSHVSTKSSKSLCSTKYSSMSSEPSPFKKKFRKSPVRQRRKNRRGKTQASNEESVS